MRKSSTSAILQSVYPGGEKVGGERVEIPGAVGGIVTGRDASARPWR